MSLDDLLAEIDARGLAIVMVQHQVTLHGPKEQATATLLAVLRWHKQAITSHLVFRREKVWEWDDGRTYQAVPWADEWHPPGATIWRWVNDDLWKVIRQERVA